MVTVEMYNPSMQTELETCFKNCVNALCWDYQPSGRHSDIVNIEDTYMYHGCFWCAFEDNILIGMVAMRCIDKENSVAELKRLYVLPKYQGRGYGGLLFELAMNYTKEQDYKTVRIDTRHDRYASLHLIDKYQFRRTARYNENSFSELYFELDLKQAVNAK